jgi:ABC-type uncharacterized transport system involved in gliding motility auxiliary subunit
MRWNRQQWSELAASVGAACLIAGYLRYSIQEEWLPLNEGLLIAGGVLLLAAIVGGFGGIVRFFSRRSSKLGTNTVVLAVAVMAILVVVNFLTYQHHHRFDLTSEKLYTLSPQTKNVVKGLRTDVDIVRFAKQPDAQLDDLMTEYKNISSHIKFRNVDPQERPEVAKQYNAQHMGDVIVAAGTRQEPLEQNPDGGITEEDVTSAILKVTRDKVKTVCFVTGHGEKSLTDTSARGYSLVDQGLKREAYKTESVNLVSSNGVPSDCDIAVVAGPTQAFFPQEATLLAKYLNGGGKALIEVDPETDPKLDDLFKAWNLNVGANVVVDASGVGRLFGTGPAVPLVVDYGDSPITKNLQGGMTFFPLARTVSIADKSKLDPQAVELLKTSQRSFTIPNLQQKEVKFDPKTDTPGPLSLGVAADKKSGDLDSRLVVLGDSDFAANQWISLQHNGDLFFNTIDWLAQDENLISIRPKTVTNRRVTMTEGAASGLRWLDLIFLPGIVIIIGIGIWWKRR